ncbi:MAG: hypothetical protein FJ379_08255 [Verrucomicrobia bacterium]|nr:hypothetical protein [Verrucomicrobiota bacterium]
MESPAFRLRNPRAKRDTPHRIRQRVDILGRNQLARPAKTEGLRDAIQGGCHDRSAAGVGLHNYAAHGLGADLGVHQAVEGVHDKLHLQKIPRKSGESLEAQAPDVLLQKWAHVSASHDDKSGMRDICPYASCRLEEFSVSLTPGKQVAPDHTKDKSLRRETPSATLLKDTVVGSWQRLETVELKSTVDDPYPVFRPPHRRTKVPLLLR